MTMTRDERYPTGPEPVESVLNRIGYDCLNDVTCRVGGNDEIHGTRCLDFNHQRAVYARIADRYPNAANGVDVNDYESKRFVGVLSGEPVQTYSLNDLRRVFESPGDDFVVNLHAAHGGSLVRAKVVAFSPARPDEDDYSSMTYAVVSDQNYCYGRFGVRIDGRA